MNVVCLSHVYDKATYNVEALAAQVAVCQESVCPTSRTAAETMRNIAYQILRTCRVPTRMPPELLGYLLLVSTTAHPSLPCCCANGVLLSTTFDHASNSKPCDVYTSYKHVRVFSMGLVIRCKFAVTALVVHIVMLRDLR